MAEREEISFFRIWVEFELCRSIMVFKNLKGK
jgi:hypothetical protein